MNRPGGELANSWALNEIGTVMLGEPTATLQYVRKISGLRGTRQAQAEAFCHAIDAVAADHGDPARPARSRGGRAD